MIALVVAIVTLLPMTALAEPVIDSRAVQAQSTRTTPLAIGEVLARIELTHPLLGRWEPSNRRPGRKS